MKIFCRESGLQISNGKGCPPKIFSENQVPKSLIAKGFSPEGFFQRIKSPNLKSQGGTPKICSENQVPNLKSQKGVPLIFLRESGPQISNGKGCPLKTFFRESRPQIPPRFFRESSPQLSSCLLVLLYFGGRRHPNIISLRFRFNYPCGALRSFSSYYFIFIFVCSIVTIFTA